MQVVVVQKRRRCAVWTRLLIWLEEGSREASQVGSLQSGQPLAVHRGRWLAMHGRYGLTVNSMMQCVCMCEWHNYWRWSITIPLEHAICELRCKRSAMETRALCIWSNHERAMEGMLTAA